MYLKWYISSRIDTESRNVPGLTSSLKIEYMTKKKGTAEAVPFHFVSQNHLRMRGGRTMFVQEVNQYGNIQTIDSSVTISIAHLKNRSRRGAVLE